MKTSPEILQALIKDSGLLPQVEMLEIKRKKGSLYIGIPKETTFTQSVLRAMGIEDLEGSPTYSLINEYVSPYFGKVYHMDLYRLNSLDEALDIGIEELLYQNVICFIEWPEKIKELLPDNTIWVYLRANEDLSRIITIKDENKS